YREMLPLFDGEQPLTLGEGFTPLVHARTLGASLGLSRLYIKDESLNPTNSFKARGQSAAVTRAKYLGATTIALPTAGNAGNAAAAYAAAAGLACEVYIPKDAKRPIELVARQQRCAARAQKVRLTRIERRSPAGNRALEMGEKRHRIRIIY